MHNNDRLRALALRHRELAESPMMESRRNAWRALHDLKPIRPVCIFETELLSDFIAPAELTCDTLETRALEERLLHGVKHVENIDDDYVLEPFFTAPLLLDTQPHDYGVGLEYISNPVTHAVVPNHPLREPEDIAKLKKRIHTYDNAKNQSNRAIIQEMIGKCLPVILQYSPGVLPQISKYTFDLIGMDSMYYWAIDCPEVITKLADYVADDFLERYRLMERERLLNVNNKNTYAGAGSLGYVSDLKEENPTTLSNMWVWMESQETETLSPDMLEALFLPAMGRVASEFGIVYYGCCERLHDRMDRIFRHIRNIRAVSVSPWSNVDKMAEMLDNKMVFSRKLNPVHITSDLVWEEIDKDIDHVMRAMPSGLVEFIYRNVYAIGGDMGKIQSCMQRIKAKIQ